MKLKIFTLYDEITEEYGSLMLAKTNGHMARILKDNLKPEQALEYSLWELGVFDTENGSLTPHKQAQRVNLGILEDIEELSEKAKIKKQQEENFMKDKETVHA